MLQTVALMAKNIRHLKDVKHLSQKEVCADAGVPHSQYSRIEDGKVVPSISTLEKLASVFYLDIAELFKSDDLEQEVNLPLMQKIKMIDLALANKRMKDNLQTLIAQ
jgi:transcriptional regulator with XRE-family HTH domain